MKSVFIYCNIIFIKINNQEGQDKYVQAYRQGGINLNNILTKSEIDERYPNGTWLKGINVSDTITFLDV